MSVFPSMAFPDGFLFASSSSAYQVEGAWNEDGKGKSIWDHLTHTRSNLVKNHENGDIACDSYHLYTEDVKWLKYMGFDVYRFSINWPRILPNGEITKINQAGVNYYHKLIDDLLRNGIQPMVTIYHWDLPQKLQDLGGWTNPLIVDFVEDYADLLFQFYGNKVKLWLTINEPIEMIKGYETGTAAPGLKLDSPANYIVGHNTLRAHARIYRLYDRKYRSEQNGKITISLSTCYHHPKTNSKEDIEAADRAMQFYLGSYAHPIYSNEGDYPPIVRQLVDAQSNKEGRKRSRLPTFTDEEKQALKGSFDFFSLNHYTTLLCSSGHSADDSTFIKDMNVSFTTDPNWPGCTAVWLKVVPWGFRELLKFVKDNYNNPPVFITESGYCDEGELEDIGRINFYKDYLMEMLNAMNNYGCNIIGYTAWSILDNFEWFDGYQSKFGLIHVDFNDKKRKRTPKKSVEFFKNVLQTRTLSCDL